MKTGKRDGDQAGWVGLRLSINVFLLDLESLVKKKEATEKEGWETFPETQQSLYVAGPARAKR